MARGTENRMTPEQTARLVRLIGDRTGICIPEPRRTMLERWLQPRLDELGLDDFDQYLRLLGGGPCREEEFQELLGRITIDETSFFRDPAQLDAFERDLLPELIAARRGQRRLRLWSAACSSGEEAYTLALLVRRALGEELGSWEVEIFASDIAERRLEAARAGRYDAYAVRGVPRDLLERCFCADGQGYVLDRSVRGMVRFARHNLRERLATRRLGAWDVIFCRNVLIYFDAGTRGQVAQTLGESLAPDGCLLVGHGESLLGLGAPLEEAPLQEAFCYRRAAAAGRAA